MADWHGNISQGMNLLVAVAFLGHGVVWPE
jgi:hypothetical protein